MREKRTRHGRGQPARSHAGDPVSLLDYNRAGVPLIEIVSQPDLRSAAAAAEYLRAIRRLVRYLRISDGNMDEGSLRCDANVSIRPRGSEALGTKVEIKNINSFRFVEKAIEHEIARQIDVVTRGGSVRPRRAAGMASAGPAAASAAKKTRTTIAISPIPICRPWPSIRPGSPRYRPRCPSFRWPASSATSPRWGCRCRMRSS